VSFFGHFRLGGFERQFHRPQHEAWDVIAKAFWRRAVVVAIARTAIFAARTFAALIAFGTFNTLRTAGSFGTFRAFGTFSTLGPLRARGILVGLLVCRRHIVFRLARTARFTPRPASPLAPFTALTAAPAFGAALAFVRRKIGEIGSVELDLRFDQQFNGAQHF
jgi:hypothetical protein